MKILEARDRYLSWLKERGLKLTTTRHEGYTLIHFAEFMKLRNVEALEGVTSGLVEEYRTRLGEKVVPSTGRKRLLKTVITYLETVKAFFLHAAERGWILANPAERILWDMPLRDGSASVLTTEEMEKVLAVPDAATPIGARDRAILELMYSTGIRMEEVARLELADLDMAAGRLRIRATERHMDRVVPLGELSSPTSAARVYLERYLNEIRPAWWGFSEANRLRRGRLGPVRAKRRGTAVFLSPRSGDAMSEINVEDMVRESVQAVKPGVVFAGRAIRHACAARLMKEGYDLPALHVLFGYKRMRDTAAFTRAAPSSDGRRSG